MINPTQTRGERLVDSAFKGMADKELEFDDVVAVIFTSARGKRLAKVRRSMNLNQSELAVKLGIRQRILSRIESGGGVYCSPRLTARLMRDALAGSGLRYVLFGRHGYQFEKPGADADWQKRVKNPGNRTPGGERIMSTKHAREAFTEFYREWKKKNPGAEIQWATPRYSAKKKAD